MSTKTRADWEDEQLSAAAVRSYGKGHDDGFAKGFAAAEAKYAELIQAAEIQKRRGFGILRKEGYFAGVAGSSFGYRWCVAPSCYPPEFSVPFFDTPAEALIAANAWLEEGEARDA